MKGKQTKNNSNDFRATDSEFWKKQHGYDDKKAEKASDWMSKHYSDLGEAVKINESHIMNIVSEALVKLISESSIGEVDKHQLYAWYANERNKQANGERGLSTAQQRLGTTSDQLRKKSEIGKNNAVDAFNKKYKRGWNSQGDSFSTGMGDNYSITTNQEFNSHDKDGIPLQTKTTNVFDPYNDSEKEHKENYENGALKSASDYETPKSLPGGPRYTATHGPERVAARKMALGRLDETEYTSLKSKDTRKGKVGVSKDDENNYYVDYDGKHYHVPSQEDADRWHEILSIDESRIKAIVKESLNNILKEEEEKPTPVKKKRKNKNF